MPRHLPLGKILLAALLIAAPTPSLSQHHSGAWHGGGGWHGGGWRGGYGRVYGYGSYYGYRPYGYAYGGYYGWGGYPYYGAALGVLLAPLFWQPRVYYYPYPPSPPPPPMQHCQDGSLVPMGSYCPQHPVAVPAPVETPPPALPAPTPERG